MNASFQRSTYIKSYKYLSIVLILSSIQYTQAIQLGSTVQQLEQLEQADSKIQEFVTYLQDAYEQFNYKYLSGGQPSQQSNKDTEGGIILEKQDGNGKQQKLAQVGTGSQEGEKTSSKMIHRTNLLGKDVPEDNTLLQTNSENQFLGTLLWKFVDFISLGAFENHVSDDEKRERNEVNKTSNSTPLEPPMSADLMMASMHPEPALMDSKMKNPSKLQQLLKKEDDSANKNKTAQAKTNQNKLDASQKPVPQTTHLAILD